MSVIESKRQESNVKFLHKAMNLVEHTLKYTTAKKFNKSDKDVVRRIRDLGIEVLVEVEKANSIFPKSQLDIEERYIHFSRAIGSCEALCSLLCVVKHSLPNEVTTYGWEEWGNILDDEIKLIKKTILSDKNLKF